MQIFCIFFNVYSPGGWRHLHPLSIDRPSNCGDRGSRTPGYNQNLTGMIIDWSRLSPHHPHQREFDWILTLPPSAFASPEMLDWLKRDLAAASRWTFIANWNVGLKSECWELANHFDRPALLRTPATPTANLDLSWVRVVEWLEGDLAFSLIPAFVFSSQ